MRWDRVTLLGESVPSIDHQLRPSVGHDNDSLAGVGSHQHFIGRCEARPQMTLRVISDSDGPGGIEVFQFTREVIKLSLSDIATFKVKISIAANVVDEKSEA